MQDKSNRKVMKPTTTLRKIEEIVWEISKGPNDYSPMTKETHQKYVTQLEALIQEQEQEIPEADWESRFEDLWKHWIYLTDIKVGVNFNTFKNGIKSVFKHEIAQARKEERERIVKDIRSEAHEKHHGNDEWHIGKDFLKGLKENL